jgi:short-subunit dehydrogenase
VIVARSRDRLEQVAKDVAPKHGVNVEVFLADLDNSTDLDKLARYIETNEKTRR